MNKRRMIIRKIIMEAVEGIVAYIVLLGCVLYFIMYSKTHITDNLCLIIGVLTFLDSTFSFSTMIDLMKKYRRESKRKRRVRDDYVQRRKKPV
ncbi:hypothetical protein ACTQZS_08035 [Bilifractor sp. LCP19S3_H10]|uniref:hypothetical protein n=1 Tax=Bilifractor sp. LCP19S3_H10 TaxID=3438736 RepID=UPI003F92CBAD